MSKNMKRISFARIYVEVSVDKPLVDIMDLDLDYEQTIEIVVEYQWKPKQCLSCKVFGHSQDQCIQDSTIKGNGEESAQISVRDP